MFTIYLEGVTQSPVLSSNGMLYAHHMSPCKGRATPPASILKPSHTTKEAQNTMKGEFKSDWRVAALVQRS